jgi:hypothetical protein
MANVSGTVIEVRKDGKGIKLDSTGYMYGAFSASQLGGVAVGSQVSFDYTEGKPNPSTGMPYLNIKGNVKILGGTASLIPTTAFPSPSTPSYSKHPEKVGEPILSNSRCIIRQNAMKTAADILRDYASNFTSEAFLNFYDEEEIYFNHIRRIAERIEAYTSGDEDEANAKKELDIE